MSFYGYRCKMWLTELLCVLLRSTAMGSDVGDSGKKCHIKDYFSERGRKKSAVPCLADQSEHCQIQPSPVYWYDHDCDLDRSQVLIIICPSSCHPSSVDPDPSATFYLSHSDIHACRHTHRETDRERERERERPNRKTSTDKQSHWLS